MNTTLCADVAQTHLLCTIRCWFHILLEEERLIKSGNQYSPFARPPRDTVAGAGIWRGNNQITHLYYDDATTMTKHQPRAGERRGRSHECWLKRYNQLKKRAVAPPQVFAFLIRTFITTHRGFCASTIHPSIGRSNYAPLRFTWNTLHIQIIRWNCSRLSPLI